MKEQLTRVLSPRCIATDPQSYTSSPADGIAAVEEMIFHDKMDIVYDPKVCSRRCRIEWPSGDPAIRDILLSSTSDNDTSVTGLASKLENNIGCDSEYLKARDIKIQITVGLMSTKLLKLISSPQLKMKQTGKCTWGICNNQSNGKARRPRKEE